MHTELKDDIAGTQNLGGFDPAPEGEYTIFGVSHSQRRMACVVSQSFLCPQALKHDVASGKDVAAGQKRVVYQLQLLGCTFRRALRKSGKRIISRLSGAADGNPSEVEERCAAASICDLLEATDAAILTVQKVRGPASALLSRARLSLQLLCSDPRPRDGDLPLCNEN